MIAILKETGEKVVINEKDFLSGRYEKVEAKPKKKVAKKAKKKA